MAEKFSLSKWRWTVGAWQKLGPLIGLAVVLLLFSAAPGFLTAINFKFILTQTVIVAIASLGMTMIIASGGIDLSVGSVVAFTCVCGALAVQAELPLAVVVLVSVFSGGIFGLLNGVIIAGFKMNPFIVTLGMMGVARGAAKWAARNQTVNYDPASPVNLAMNNHVHWPLWVPPMGVLLALLMALVFAVILNYTVFGRHIFAIGSNEATARLCGIRTRFIKVAMYSSAGLLYGLAGLMQASRLQQGSPTVAVGLELDVIAAVVIGGASLSGGTGSVTGSVIGALIMASLRNGTQLMGWENHVQEIIIGMVIILAVGIDRIRHKNQF